MPWSPTSRRSGWTSVNGWATPWCWAPPGSARRAWPRCSSPRTSGVGMCDRVSDPKGDAGLLKRIYTRRKIRAGQEFHAVPSRASEVSARYNAIGNFSRITEVATVSPTSFPSEEQLSGIQGSSPGASVNIIARALVALKRQPDYQQVGVTSNDIEPSSWVRGYHLDQQGRRRVESTGRSAWDPSMGATCWHCGPKQRYHRAYASSAESGSLRPGTRWPDVGLPNTTRPISTRSSAPSRPLMEKLTGNIAELISPGLSG